MTPTTLFHKFSGLVAFILLISTHVIHADTVTYIIPGPDGSPLAGMNEAGAVTWREDYQPFGEKLVNSPAASDNDIWFAGKEFDDDTGLAFFGARNYEPTIGRFVSIDPQGFDEENIFSFGRYAYGNNNPYKFIDPDGEAAETIIDVVSLGLSVDLFKNNPSFGNAVGVLLDSAVTAAPFVPGGVGIVRSATKGAAKPLLGKNPTLGKNKNRVNTELEGGTATANSIFRNQSKGQNVTQKQLGRKGGVRRVAEDGTEIRLPNNGGGARVDLPGRGSAGRETIHFTP